MTGLESGGRPAVVVGAKVLEKSTWTHRERGFISLGQGITIICEKKIKNTPPDQQLEEIVCLANYSQGIKKKSGCKGLKTRTHGHYLF